ncbi:MAG: hypothetical protein GVY13_01990 [Alphaproteobacteria bacterium]|jgi:hypothetical protein|nr:hypothetical protein [Alphaproteobacteria bacterium]
MLDNTAFPSAAAASFSVGTAASGEAGGVAPSSARTHATGQSGTLSPRAVAEPEAMSAAPLVRKEPPVKEPDAAEAGRKARKEAEEARQAEKAEQARLAELWRPRFDPESLRMFTEIIDPKTRDARYTVPPTMKLSEEAQRESEALSKKERFLKDSGMIV